MDCKQTTREISVDTPLNDGELCFYRMTGTEELGRPFKYDLELVSDNPNIELHKVLGKSITVTLKLAKSKNANRYYNGYVSHFRYLGEKSGYHFYHAVLRPWLWFLTRTANCRVFQNKTTPEIIKAIFDDYSFAEYDINQLINKQYYLDHQWDYCVQYRESAFNFVSRIMEQTGVYYHFVHNNSLHTLTLADAVSSHPASDLVLDYSKAGEVYEWFVSQKIQPDAVTLEDYTFTIPPGAAHTRLSKQRDVDTPSPDLGLGIYDYLAGYTSVPGASSVGSEFPNQQLELENAVNLKAEEFEAEYARVHAKTLVREVKAGGLFNLANHPRADQNAEYLTVYTKYELVSNLYRSIVTDPDEHKKPVYACEFSAMATGVQQDGSYAYTYRSAATTPKPIVYGPQAAFVIDHNGKFDDSSTVNTVVADDYGRVRVSFPWCYDRPNPKFIDSTQTPNEPEKINYSSCWVRVSQVWAGADWGAMHAPHVGQEVIVEFYEGDPNRPIITGRVYNADHKPWAEWKGDKDSSYIKDHHGNYILYTKEGKVEFTEKDKSKWTVANEYKGNWGNKVDLAAGFKLSGVGGVKVDVNVGGVEKVSVANINDFLIGLNNKFIFGGLHQFLWGYEFKWYTDQKLEKLDKGKSVLTGDDQIVSSEKTLCLVGAAKGKGKADKTSIINAKGEGISLSVGEQKEVSGVSKKKIEKVMLSRMVIEGILASVASVVAASVPNALPNKAGRVATGSVALGTTLGTIAIFDLVTAILITRQLNKITKAEKDIKAIKHKDSEIDAKIEINKDGSISSYAKNNISMNNDKSLIGLDKDGKINISADKDVVIESYGFIDLIAEKKVRAKGTAFDVRGALKHKNFEVLAN
jgi:type VI secretion system secreted protein VgrG